jgi:hypothetical protein
MATNVKGESLVSEAGNGAIIVTSPDAPSNLIEKTASRSFTELGMTWDEPYNGGSAIIEYRVNYAVQGQSFSVLGTTTNTEFLAT